MKKRLQKTLAIILTAALLLCCLPGAFAAEGFADMPDDWSTRALERAVENGLLRGSERDGALWLRPGDALTRAELAAVVNRAFGAERAAELTGVADVSADAWYAADMGKAAAMGTFKVDAAMRPEARITRQEAFTVLARAFHLSAGDGKALDAFQDGAQVADWARASVSGLVEAGCVSGSRGLLSPTAEITRAEFAQMMDNMVKRYISAPGEVTDLGDGSVLVNTAGVTLKDTAVKGDLILGDGVGDGEVTLDGVTVEGRLLARGGGAHSIILTGSTKVGEVVLARRDGQLRLRVEKGAAVDAVLIPDGSDAVTVVGELGSLTLEAPGVTVNAVGADIGKAEITGEKAVLVVEKDSKVQTASVAESAEGAQVVVAGQVKSVTVEAPAAAAVAKEGGRVDQVTLTEKAEGATVQADKGAAIQSVTSKADGAAIQGEGKIASAKVEGDNNSVNTVGTKVTVDKNAEGTKANDQTLKGGSTSTTTESGAKPSTGTGGGSYVPPSWDGTSVKEVTPVEGVYTVSSAEELAWVAAQVNSGAETFKDKTVRLGGDIDLNNQNWTPIGNGDHAFEGSFDGNKKTVENLSITSDAEYGHLALFGRAAGTAERHAVIKDVTVSGTVANEYVFDKDHDNNGRYTALVVAEGIFIDLSGVTARGAVSTSCRTAGGIAGMIRVEGSKGQNVGSIQDCMNFASVNGKDQVGGIAGYTRTNGTGYLTVERCGNEGSIAAEAYAGGITGLSGMTSFDRCYNKGAVAGAVAGGIVGTLNSGTDEKVFVANCYNLGAVDGLNSAAGGILGADATGGGLVQYCYSTGAVTTTNEREGKTTSAGIYGSTGGNLSTRFRNNYYLSGTADFGACSGYVLSGGSGAMLTGAADIAGQFEAKTAEELKSAGLAVALNNGDMTDAAAWRTVAESNPVLAWENVPGAELPVPQPWDGTSVDTSWYTDLKGVNRFSIYVPEQLAGLAKLVNEGNTLAGKTITLMTDIDLGGHEWTPIGTITAEGMPVPFSGAFYGQGHLIKGLSIQNPSTVEAYGSIMFVAGLFGTIGGEGCVLDGVHVEGNININEDKDTISALVGGIAGAVMEAEATLQDCRFDGEMTLGIKTLDGNNMAAAGGILGGCAISPELHIVQCVNTAKITAKTSGLSVGGIAGYLWTSLHDKQFVENCYNIGAIEGMDNVGGIAGHFRYSTMTGCFNYGDTTYGLAGLFDEAEIKNSYYLSGADKKAYFNHNDHDNGAVVEKPEDNVKGLTEEAFTDLVNFEGFSEAVWEVVNGLYPTLK